jgi:hypothetical protein
VQANRTRSSLATYLTWAMREGLTESNAALLTNKNAEKPRERVLSNDEVKAQAERHGVLLRFKVTNEFTTKLLHSENHDPALVQSIYETCTLRTSCHTLHKGRYYKCSPSPFVADWLRRVQIEPPDLLGDSIGVRDNPNLRQELAAYLSDGTPLTACRFCLGCVGKTVPSWQMNKAAAQRWMAEKDPDIRELVRICAIASFAAGPCSLA